MSFYADGTNSGDNELMAKTGSPWPNINAAYTICGWVKPRALPGSTGMIARVRCGFVNEDNLKHTTAGDIEMNGLAGYAATIDDWIFVAIVRTSTTSIKLFVDHVEIAEDTTDISARAASDFFIIGAEGFFVGTPHCMLGRWRVWETNLTAGELLTEAGSATAVKSGCWGDYRMQSGAVADDSSGNARHFDLSSAVYDTDEPPLGSVVSFFRLTV